MTDELKAKALQLQSMLLDAGTKFLGAKATISPAEAAGLLSAAAAAAQAAVALKAIVDQPNPGVARGIVDPPPDPGYVPTDPPPDPGRK